MTFKGSVAWALNSRKKIDSRTKRAKKERATASSRRTRRMVRTLLGIECLQGVDPLPGLGGKREFCGLIQNFFGGFREPLQKMNVRQSLNRRLLRGEDLQNTKIYLFSLGVISLRRVGLRLQHKWRREGGIIVDHFLRQGNDLIVLSKKVVAIGKAHGTFLIQLLATQSMENRLIFQYRSELPLHKFGPGQVFPISQFSGTKFDRTQSIGVSGIHP